MKKNSDRISKFLTMIGLVALIASLVSFVVTADQNIALAIVVTLSEVVAGALLLGFAKALDYLREISQQMQ
jgi:hypothetical protein